MRQTDDPNKQGIKHDENKIRTDLLCPRSIMGTAKVLTAGAKKYTDRNWEQGMEWSRPYGAALRHLLAFWAGEDIDPESGLPHLDHASCCIHFLQEYQYSAKRFDDRPVKPEASNE